MLTAASADGTSIAYSVADAAAPWHPTPTTIFMHHGLGFSGEAWSDWLPVLLGRGFRVIRIDMRGHGGSARFAPEPRWSTDALLADVDAVLDREGVEACHFVGESWGGTIGLARAARRPGRVRSVTVMSTTYAGRLVPDIESFPAMLRSGEVEAWSRRMVQGRFTADADPALKQWAHQAQMACSPEMLAAMFEYIMAQDIADALGRVRCPVLVLAPQGSPFVPPTVATDLAARLADSELQRFPGHRHGLVLSAARPAAEALVSFIDRRGGG